MNTAEIIAVVISSLSFLTSLITYFVTLNFNNKNEFLKLYHAMINNDEIYSLMIKIEYEELVKEDLYNKNIEKKLDMYLCHIETMIRFSNKYSMKYLKRELFFIKNTSFLWEYICELNDLKIVKAYTDLQNFIIKYWSRI